MRKPWLAMLLVLTMLPIGCVAQAREITVTAAFYPIYVTCLNITQGVQGVRLSCLAPPNTGCLHDYQLTTEDRRLLMQTDLFVMHGAGMEEFLSPNILGQLNGVLCDASEGLEGLVSLEGEDNPHLWVSIPAAMRQAETIAAALSAIDPANSALYEANLAVYLEKLSALDVRLREGLAPFAGEKIVTFHDAFDYWAWDYGLVVAGVMVVEPNASPSARKLAQVVRTVQDEGVRALFDEPQAESGLADVVSRETGVPVYVLDPVATGELNDPDAFLRAMERNLITLREALEH